MNNKKVLERILEKAVFSGQDGLIPAIVQDAASGHVLMLGYMNKKALKQTVKTGLVTFYSRSRKQLWEKGETSGNKLLLQSLELDCDNDALLVKARPTGPVCHKGDDTCWAEVNGSQFNYLLDLEAIIRDRKRNPKPNSYTNRLLDRGLNKIAQKVGEEAVEVVIEAKENDLDLFRGEVADLLYHLSLLLVEKGTGWAEVLETLRARRK